MPRYKITAPDGREVTIEGDSAPTEVEAAEIFSTLPPKASATAPVIAVAEAGAEPADRGRMLEGGILGELGLPADSTSQALRGGGVVADIATEGGGGAAGQAIGALTGPAAPLLIPLLGGFGGGMGNYAAQRRRILSGEQDSFRPGELLSSVLTSAIPGGPLAGSGGRAVLREGGKQAAAGLTGTNLQTLVDEGRMASPIEGVLASTIPAIGGASAQKMQAANPAVRAAVQEATTGTGATIRKTFEAAQKAGYSIPQSIARKELDEGASMLGDTVESFGGKAATIQEASVRNQKVTNKLAKKALGLPENRDLTSDAIDAIRDEAAKPYAAIETMAVKADTELKDLLKKNQGMSTHETEARLAEPGTAARRNSLTVQAAADVQELRKARKLATAKFRQFKTSADPAHQEQAEAALAMANDLEEKIEAAAVEFGKPQMVDELRKARTRIAKTYDVEKALNTANANVDAKKLAAALRNGRPLTEELKVIADTALAFDPVMRESSRVGAPGVSAFQIAGMLGGAFGGQAALGPYGVLMGTAPLARPAARSLALSDFATRIPMSIDVRPPLSPLLTRTLSQTAGQQLADETSPPKKN